MTTFRQHVKRKFVAGALLVFCMCVYGLAAWAQESQPTLLYLPAIANAGVAPRVTPVPANDKELAIQLVAAHPPIAEVLANYPNWVADAYPDDEANRFWHVDFYAEPDGEHLGYGHIYLNTGEITEVSMPRELSPEEFQAGQAKIQAYLLYDAEVQALLGNPDFWYREINYNKWDERWEVYYSRGIEEWMLWMGIDAEDGKVYLREIVDPGALNAEKALEQRRNQAIELAYSATGVDEALTGVDNWRTYAEDQGNNLWSVSFAVEEHTLFSALVNVANGQVIESGK